MTALIVGIFGGSGALARFLLDTGVRRAWPTRFPVATLLVNISGSALLGAITAYVVGGGSGEVGAAIGVGFCGGYTTFSTAMFETIVLVRDRRIGAGLCTLLGQPVVCILAAAGAYALVARG